MTKKIISLLCCLFLLFLFMGCPSDDNGDLPDITVSLGDDEGGQGNTTVVDNGDGTIDLTFNSQYAWWQRAIPSAPQDLTGYSTITFVISNGFAAGADHGIKLDILDDGYASIFADSNANWRNLTNGASEEAITYDISGEDLTSVQAVVLQNNTNGDTITIHSITFSE